MHRTALYIADMDSAFVSRIRSALKESGGIEIVGCAANGKRALTEILRLSPDVLLMDISLPELDGIALLREVRRMKRPPTVIVCTRFYSSASMECTCRYGASFFLCKPVEPDSIASLVLECRQAEAIAPSPTQKEQDSTSADLRRANAARALLSRLGLPPRLNGSAYIVEAVMRFQGDRLLLKNLSNGLYSQLATHMDTTVPRIERSLRSAIAIAYERGTLSRHFSRRPTNKEFIEYVMREVDAVSGPAESI